MEPLPLRIHPLPLRMDPLPLQIYLLHLLGSLFSLGKSAVLDGGYARCV